MNSFRHVNKRWQVKTSLVSVPVTGPRSSLLRVTSEQSRLIHHGVGSKTAYAKHKSAFQFERPQNTAPSRALFSSKSGVSREPTIHSVYEENTGTWQYVVADPSTQIAVIIDPVLDYDPSTQIVSSQTADSLLSIIKDNGYKVDRILETHAHADHLTAATYLQKCLAEWQGHRPPICIGRRIKQVQRLYGPTYGVPANEYEGVFDKLLDDDETFAIGDMTATTIHLPGHTPDHVGYKIGGNVFCGDSIFHADIGTARCDFPGGSANDLFDSGRKLLAMPDDVKIWTGHDYPSDARRTPVPWLSVKDHKMNNKHLQDSVRKEDFVALRETRDAGLAAPRLLHQSLQINIRAGRLPGPTASGYSLLHVPLKLSNIAWQPRAS